MRLSQVDAPVEKSGDMDLPSLAEQLVLAESRLSPEVAIRAARTSADFACFEMSGYVSPAGVAAVVRTCFDFRFSHLLDDVSK